MNNLEFDHGDIFRDLQDISRSFSHLLRIVPSDGLFFATETTPTYFLFQMLHGLGSSPLEWGMRMNFVSQISQKMQPVHGSVFHGTESNHDGRLEYTGLFNARNLAMATLASVLAQQICKVQEPFDIGSQNPFSGVSLPDFSGCAGVKEGRRSCTTARSSWFFPTLPIIPPRLPVPWSPCVPVGLAGKLSPASSRAATPPSPMCLRNALLMPLPLLMSACLVPSTVRKKSLRINGSILRI